MTTEVLRGATRWKIVLQTSRTFLNQHFQDQTAGKPKIRGQHVRVNPKKSVVARSSIFLLLLLYCPTCSCIVSCDQDQAQLGALCLGGGRPAAARCSLRHTSVQEIAFCQKGGDIARLAGMKPKEK